MKFRIYVSLALIVALAMIAGCGGSGGDLNPAGEERPFPEIEEAARGTTVNFFMYGGDDATNAYVDEYVTPRLAEEYDVTLERTPVEDIAEVVNKLLNERQAGEDEGTVDLVWINGENFATGADANLWFGPWSEQIPNAQYVDWESEEVAQDFGYPVEGREAPWGKAQFVMIYDSEEVPDPPKNPEELRAWVEENPGKFTYPAPPDFTANAFIEQMFYGLAGDPEYYQQSDFDQVVFDEQAPKLYEFLKEIEPSLWRGGETYPESSARLDELYQNGEVLLNMSYIPQSAQRQVDKGIFPESTRSYLLDYGTLANTHYVAIPFNSTNKEGAQVVANLLEDPEAQIEKQKPSGWGDLTALELDRLPEDLREQFAEPSGPATLPLEVLRGNRLPEARSEWLLALEEGWREEVARN